MTLHLSAPQRSAFGFLLLPQITEPTGIRLSRADTIHRFVKTGLVGSVVRGASLRMTLVHLSASLRLRGCHNSGVTIATICFCRPQVATVSDAGGLEQIAIPHVSRFTDLITLVPPLGCQERWRRRCHIKDDEKDGVVGGRGAR